MFLGRGYDTVATSAERIRAPDMDAMSGAALPSQAGGMERDTQRHFDHHSRRALRQEAQEEGFTLASSPTGGRRWRRDSGVTIQRCIIENKRGVTFEQREGDQPRVRKASVCSCIIIGCVKLE